MKQSKKELLLKGMEEADKTAKDSRILEVQPENKETSNLGNKETSKETSLQGSKETSLQENKDTIGTESKKKSKPRNKRTTIVESYSAEHIEEIPIIRTTIDIRKDILDKLNYLKTMYKIKTGKRVSIVQMFEDALLDYLEITYKKFKEIDDVNPFES